MDSISNLSLLEIAAEDDSLLLDVPRSNDDSTLTTATNDFSCSPIQCLRSLPPHPPKSVGSVDSENLSSSPKYGLNKENMNWNKSEAPKLSVEPQQMKRKKKGGGYNLRKSLAWDRAFFTEEGVLNPLELSMLSGTNTELKVIREEEEEASVGGTGLVSASSELQKIEENLFKHSSDGNSIEGRKIGNCLSPNPDALNKDTHAPASLAKRKVLAVNDVNRIGNRSKRNACPRPVVSSSLKRPETAKTPSKESKVTKIPGPKSNVCLTTSSAKSGTLSTGFLKRSHKAYPSTTVQKHVGAKCLSKNPRTTPGVSKIDLADKCSVSRNLTKQAGKDLDNSVSVTHPPPRLHQFGTKVNKVSEACLPQGVSDTGEKMQQTQFQTTKPSGLRMPSPSLGFFSQAKTSSSHSKSQKFSKRCKPAECNIPKLRKFEVGSVNETNLPQAPIKSSEIANGATKNCANVLSFSDVKLEPSLQVDNNHMAGIEVQRDSSAFEKTSKQELVQSIIEPVNIKSKGQAEPHGSDNVSDMEEMEFHGEDKKFLSINHTHEHLEKVDHHPLKDKFGDPSEVKEPESVDQHSMHRTLTGEDNLSNAVHNTMGQVEDEQIKLLSCDVQTSHEGLVLQEKLQAPKDYSNEGEFKEYNCVKTALVDSRLNDFGETALGGSPQGIPRKNTEHVNNGAGDFDSHGSIAMEHLSNRNLSVDCSDTSQSMLEALNQQPQYLHKMDEKCQDQLETRNPSIVRGISLKNENKSHINSCQLVHVATLSSNDSPEKFIPEINGVSEGEPKIVEMEECQHPGDSQSCSIQSKSLDKLYDRQPIDSIAMHDRTQAFELGTATGEECQHSGEDMNGACENEPKIVEREECQHPGDSQSGSVQSIPVDEGYDQKLIDSTAMRDRTQAFELDRMCGECIAVSPTAFSNKVNNVSPESGSLYKNNIENLHFTSQLCPKLQADCGSWENDLLTSTGCSVYELQLRDARSSRNASMHCDVHHDVTGNFEQKASLLISSESNEKLRETESLVANNCNLLDYGEFSEVLADVHSESEDSMGNGAADPTTLPQHTLPDQAVIEFDQTNREIEKSHVEDAQAQSFDENLVAYNCSNEHSVLVASDRFLFAGDDINEQSHLTVLQRPILVGVDSYHVIDRVHLDDDWLPANTASCEEMKDRNLFEGALERCITSEYNASNHHILATPEIKDGNLDVDERAERLQVDHAKRSFTDVSPSVEVQINHQFMAAEFDSSLDVSENRITEVADCSDEHCSRSENSKIPAADNLSFPYRIQPGKEGSSVNNQNLSEEAETKIFEKDEFPNSDMQHRTESGIDFGEDNSKTVHLEKFTTKSKQGVPTTEPPLNAAPFSDEWIAAIESAGEEILTMKSGAVQNSPPDKPQREPGPWSPVRKNQAIGPFDCTKHTNIPHSSP